MAREIALRQARELTKLEAPALIKAAGKPAQNAYRDFFFGMLPNENTRLAYNQAIGQFMTWADGRGLTLPEIKPGDVGVYLQQHPGAASTKKQHRSALKRFFDLLVERHICLINPAGVARTERIRVKQGSTPEIAKDEIRKLLASLEGDTLADIRDRGAIGIMIYTACRAGAVAKLRRGDYHGRPGSMSLRFREKGGNHQSIEVRHNLEQWIDAYIEQARIKTAPKDSALFRPMVRKEQRCQAKSMHANDVCRMVKRKMAQAELREELSAHSFRVATITDLIDQGIDISDVQELAGHADARTTKLYDRTNRKATRNLVERISF